MQHDAPSERTSRVLLTITVLAFSGILYLIFFS